MRLSRIYTRGGDRGRTGLVGGERVPKDHARLESYGTVDELNAVVGLVRAELRPLLEADEGWARLDRALLRIQHELFDVGSDLATPADRRWEGMRRPGDAEVARLEAEIDAFNADLEPLREFVLPGGSRLNATLHLARTVCRRAERRTVTLLAGEPEVGEAPVRYLNRLSDWFFVAARWASHRAGAPEVTWDRRHRER